MINERNHDRATDLVARMNVASTGGLVCIIAAVLFFGAFLILTLAGVESSVLLLYLAGSAGVGLVVCWVCYFVNQRRFDRIYGSD